MKCSKFKWNSEPQASGFTAKFYSVYESAYESAVKRKQDFKNESFRQHWWYFDYSNYSFDGFKINNSN